MDGQRFRDYLEYQLREIKYGSMAQLVLLPLILLRVW